MLRKLSLLSIPTESILTESKSNDDKSGDLVDHVMALFFQSTVQENGIQISANVASSLVGNRLPSVTRRELECRFAPTGTRNGRGSEAKCQQSVDPFNVRSLKSFIYCYVAHNTINHTMFGRKTRRRRKN